jgi:hypothetical protein
MAINLTGLKNSIAQSLNDLGGEVTSAVRQGSDTKPIIDLMNDLSSLEEKLGGFGSSAPRKPMAKPQPTVRRRRRTVSESPVEGEKPKARRTRGPNKNAKPKPKVAVAAGAEAPAPKATRGRGKGKNTRARGANKNAKPQSRHYQRAEPGSFTSKPEFIPHLLEVALEEGPQTFTSWMHTMFTKMKERGITKPGDEEKTGTANKPRYLSNASNLKTDWLKNGWIKPVEGGKFELTTEGKKHARNSAVNANGASAKGKGSSKGGKNKPATAESVAA